MNTFATTSAMLLAAVLAAGCAEDAGLRDESDRYPTPAPAASSTRNNANAPAVSQQTTTTTNNNGTRYQDINVQAQPASAQVPPSGGVPDQPPMNQRSMPSGNTVQPGGAPPAIPGTSSRNPGQVPPTVNQGGNTAGAAGVTR
jgi:hypothetical protein